MPPREGPRLEVQKLMDAERRLRTSVLEGTDYPDRDQDLALVRRKQKELGHQRMRRVVRGTV